MAEPRIYLDHAATTPVLPAARAAMMEGMARWANPGSLHRDGRAAKAALEDARDRIKRGLGWSGELIFTSGATEAAALAFRPSRLKGRKPILSTVEHHAILRQVPESERTGIGVTVDGLVDPVQLASLLRISGEVLVAIQHVNQETGVVQPISDIVEVTSAARATLLVDCAQSAGKLPLPQADLMIVSAHKLGGPPGIGALLVRDFGTLVPTGGQERGYRAGTENLPAILGFAAALEAPRDQHGFQLWFEAQLAKRLALETAIEGAGGSTVCSAAIRSPMVGSYYMPGLSAAAQLVRLDAMGFSVSAGSACSSGSLSQSHVMAALGLAPEWSNNCIRVSFGPETTLAEVECFTTAWTALAQEAGRRAA
jgi:cysteine desulfurase